MGTCKLPRIVASATKSCPVESCRSRAIFFLHSSSWDRRSRLDSCCNSALGSFSLGYIVRNPSHNRNATSGGPESIAVLPNSPFPRLRKNNHLTAGEPRASDFIQIFETLAARNPLQVYLIILPCQLDWQFVNSQQGTVQGMYANKIC